MRLSAAHVDLAGVCWRRPHLGKRGHVCTPLNVALDPVDLGGEAALLCWRGLASTQAPVPLLRLACGCPFGFALLARRLPGPAAADRHGFYGGRYSLGSSGFALVERGFAAVAVHADIIGGCVPG